MRKNPVRIAFGYKSGVGKDSAGEYIKYIFPNVKLLKFSSPVYEVCRQIQIIAGKPQEKDRKLLQFIGEGMKNVYADEYVWVKIAEEKINEIIRNDPLTPIVITDLRFPGEIEMLRKYDFVITNIVRNNVKKIDHYTEKLLDSYDKFDYVIENSSTLSEFCEKINSILIDLPVNLKYQ